MSARNNPRLMYAIQAEALKIIKLGTSADIEQRILSLQRMSPDRLKIIGCWPASMEEERKIHAQFSTWRKHGEWFHPAPEILYLIKERSQMKATEKDGVYKVQAGRKVITFKESYLLPAQTLNTATALDDGRGRQLLSLLQEFYRKCNFLLDEKCNNV